MFGNLTKFGVIPRGLWNTVSYGVFPLYFAARHGILGIKPGKLAAWVIARQAVIGLREQLAATTATQHVIAMEWLQLQDYVSVGLLNTATSTITVTVGTPLPAPIDTLLISFDGGATFTHSVSSAAGSYSIDVSGVASPRVAYIVPATGTQEVGNNCGAYFTVENDPYWSYVKLLCGFDAATPVDESSAAQTLTVTGAFTRTADKPFVGSKSAYMPNAGASTANYITVSNPADFNFGTNPFTIEAWVCPYKLDTLYTRNIVASAISGDNGSWGLMFRGESPARLRFNIIGNTYYDSGTTKIAVNTWHHVAVCRNGTSLYIFIDGVLAATHTISASLSIGSAGGTALRIASDWFSSNTRMNGVMDELRITKGICRYTTGFSVFNYKFPRGGM